MTNGPDQCRSLTAGKLCVVYVGASDAILATSPKSRTVLQNSLFKKSVYGGICSFIQNYRSWAVPLGSSQ